MYLELRHLRTLVMLRQCKSLTTAADKLHQTQSALSHQLKGLEHYYDAPIFIRKSKPLRFTVLGEQLLALADEILPSVERSELILRQLGASARGRLHIAMECHSCFEWLMPTMDRYRQHWRDVELDISVGFAFEPMSALQRAEVDLVVSSDVQNLPDLKFVPLFGYETLLALDKNNPLCAKERIVAPDLANQTLITYPVDTARLDVYKDFMTPAGVSPAKRRSADLSAMALQLVASGRGVAALPNWVLASYLAKDYIEARAFSPPLTATLYAVIRQSDRELAYISAFIEQAKETAAAVLTGIKAIS